MFLPLDKIEDRRIFNRAFKTGFVVGALLFIAVNVFNYYLADLKYEECKRRLIQLSVNCQFRWGFPFTWDGYNYEWAASIIDGLVLNFLVLCVFGFVTAIVFKFVAAKIAHKDSAL